MTLTILYLIFEYLISIDSLHYNDTISLNNPFAYQVFWCASALCDLVADWVIARLIMSNSQHGVNTPRVQAMFSEGVCGAIAHHMQDYPWGEVPTDLAERVAFAIQHLKAVSVVVTNRVENRHAWYAALKELRRTGVFCQSLQVVESVQNITVGSDRALLRVIVLHPSQEEEYERYFGSRSSNTRVLPRVQGGTELNSLKYIVDQWKAAW